MSKLAVFKMPEFVANNYAPELLVFDVEEYVVDKAHEVYFVENKIHIDIVAQVSMYEILYTTLEKSKHITKNDSYLYQYELDIKDEGPLFKLIIDGEEYKAKLIGLRGLQVLQMVFEIV